MFKPNKIQRRRYKTWKNRHFHAKLLTVTLLVLALSYPIKAYADNSKPLLSPVSSLELLLPTPHPVFNIFDLSKNSGFIRSDKQEEQTPLVIPTPSPETPPVEQGGTVLSKWEEFKVAVDKVAPLFNYPKNVILAQAAIESGRGTSPFALQRNNFLGINAVDWNPDAAWSFETPEECVIEYIRVVKRNFPEAYASKNNPDKLIRLLKHNSYGLMYATDPNYIQKVTSTPEWRLK